MEGADEAASRRGEEIESVSLEEEQEVKKKKEEEKKVVARVRKYEIALPDAVSRVGRSVREADCSSNACSSSLLFLALYLSASSSRKEERNDLVSNVVETPSSSLLVLSSGSFLSFYVATRS